MLKRSSRNNARVSVETLEGRTLLSGVIATIAQVPPAITIGPMTVSKDGYLWFPESDSMGSLSIAKLSEAGRKSEYPTAPTDAHGQVGGMAADASGNVWFSIILPDGTGKMGKIDSSGQITEYAMHGTHDLPHSVTLGPDGNIWVAVSNTVSGPAIERFAADGSSQSFPVAGTNPVTWLTTGADGNLWFVLGSRIAKMTTSGAVTSYDMPVPTDGSAIDLSNAHLSTASDGNVWFIGLGGLSYITPKGAVHTVPSSGTKFTSLTVGSDGNLWFSFPPVAGSQLASAPGAVIARMTPQGNVTVMPDRVDAQGSLAVQMTGANNMGIWVESQTNVLSWINLAGVPTFSPPIIQPTTKAGVVTDLNKTFSGTIASFAPSDTSTTASASNYTASIDWGDGHVTAATIVANSNGGFDVRGTNTYSSLSPGAFKQVTITVHDNKGGAAVIFGGVTVAGTPASTSPATTTTTPIATVATTPMTRAERLKQIIAARRAARSAHLAAMHRTPAQRTHVATAHPRGPAARRTKKA